MDDCVVIALFRHGLTEDNKRHAYLGWTDSPLCPLEEQRLRGRMLSHTYEHLFSSDLGRCLETLNLLFSGAAPKLVPEFREMHFGRWEGKTYGDLERDATYRNWLENPFTLSPPGGEAFSSFSDRVRAGWEKVFHHICDTGENAAIMTHAGVIRYLLSEFAPERKEFWEWNIPHGMGYELVWTKDAFRRRERCTLLREAPSTERRHG
ncbi:histidine phosphatase family protein [Ectobacillus panaciterrae]|uniref:histidine phosphatase family protein n=1 Tax=Ectobacillus panaciterrae TaxID=363872 RepID=UPI0004126A30|nr:histidine phosphatase family protein [Ectobacillus panaciterrae]